MSQNTEELVKAAAVTEDGKTRLVCAKAFDLAEKHDLTLRQIGEACNQAGIKIVKCQLGCF
jgi:hypothetical protein